MPTPNPTIAEYVEQGLNARAARAGVGSSFKVRQDGDHFIVTSWRPTEHRFDFEQYPDIDRVLEQIVAMEAVA
jgi:hypothetical protein